MADDFSSLQGLLAQFQPSPEDMASARKQAQMQFFLGLLGAPKGGEFQRVGQSGLLATHTYQDTLKQEQTQRMQAIAQAAALQKMRKDMQFTDLGMSLIGGSDPGASNGVTTSPAPAQQAPQGMPQQPQGVPSFANQRTELGFALAGKKDVADVIHRQYQVSQGPGGTLIRNGQIVGQVIPNAGMVIDGQFQALPKEATDALVQFNTAQKRGEVQAQAEMDLVPVPVGNGQTRMMTRADAAKMLSQGQQPTSQATPSYSLRGNFTPDELARAQADANGSKPFPVQYGQGMGGVGVTPSPLAMKQAETNIGVQAAQDTDIAKGQAKDYLDIVGAERQAPGNIGKYELMKKYLSNVNTGKAAPAILSLKAYAAQFAPDLAKDWTKDVPYAQAASALSNEIALQLRNPQGGAGMPGSLSNSDRDFLVSMTASSANDPRAIPMMLDARIALEKRNQDIGQLARNYRSTHGNKIDDGFYQVVQDFANSHPLFANVQMPGASASPSGWSIKRIN